MQLVVRTPTRCVLDCRVQSVTAEDTSGRFGIRPGATPIVAALVPSILTFRLPGDASPHQLVAIGSGVLRARDNRVEAAVRHAVICETVDTVRRQLVLGEREERQTHEQTERAFARLYQVLLDSLAGQEAMR